MKTRLHVNGTDYLVIENLMTGEPRIFHRINRKWSGSVLPSDARAVLAAYEAHQESMLDDRQLVRL